MINDFVNQAEVSSTSECSRLICQEMERADSFLVIFVTEIFISFNYQKCQFCQAEKHKYCY
ncbi:unnamed protein product, partial [Vitis vinifera]|uniref:Uncharacterized protein n=1 Tax=Vitis vinifera TaxID=29760 RepID=D7T3F0_VITVI